MPRFLVAILLIASAAATAAPPPELDSAPASICKVVPSGRDWVPSVEQVRLLEQVLPRYFGKLNLKADQLPATAYVYARQYTGVTRNGRQYIYGRFDLLSDDLAKRAKSGACWEVSDGGIRYWSLLFDPKRKSISNFGVNGLA